MLAFLLTSSLLTSGCSITLPIFSGEKYEPSEISVPMTTASVRSTRGLSPLSPELGVEDWRRASSAMALALDPQGNGSAVNWDNPETGTKGNFSPVSGPVLRSDEICRVFLSTLVLQTGTSKVQGTACRPSGGEWSIKEIKPWKG